MKKVLAVVTFIFVFTFLSASCLAATHDIVLETRLWMPQLDGKIKVSSGIAGTDIDIKNDLGIGNKNFTELNFSLRKKSNWRFGFGTYKDDGATNLVQAVNYNGKSFSGNTNSSVKIRYAKLGYSKEFAKGQDFTACYTADVYFVKFHTGLRNQTQNETNTQNAVLPTFGIALTNQLQKKLSLYMDFSGVPLGNKGHFYNYEAGIKWTLSDRAALQSGYRIMDVKAKSNNDYTFLKMKGPFISFVWAL
jgi:hypothetical protein